MMSNTNTTKKKNNKKLRRILLITFLILLTAFVVWFVVHHAALYQKGYRFTKTSLCKRAVEQLNEQAYYDDGTKADLTFQRIVAWQKRLPFDYLWDTDWPQEYDLIYEAVDNNTGETVFCYAFFGRGFGKLGYSFSTIQSFEKCVDFLSDQRMRVLSVDNGLSDTREEYSQRTFTLVFAFEREDVANVSVQIGDTTITSDVNGKEAVVMEHTVKGTPQQLDDLCAIDPTAFTGCAYDAQGNIVAELQDEVWVNQD